MFFEEKLKLASKLQSAQKKADDLISMADKNDIPSEIKQKIHELAQLISQ